MSVLVGSKYRGEGIEGSFDVVIVGGGLGGLGLAAVLSRYGKKVLVLERHYTAGGLSHVYKRKGYEWDVGVHYVGDVHRPESPLRALFAYATRDELEWSYLGDIYDKLKIAERELDLVAGREGFCETIDNAFPDDQGVAARYLDLAAEVCRSSDIFFVDKVSPANESAFCDFSARMDSYFKFAKLTAAQGIGQLTDNKELLAVLTGQWGNYGLPPQQASFVMQAMCSCHYLEGGNYPLGGAVQMARAMTGVIEAGGGRVFTNAEVSEILIADGVARGVELTDGTKINAPIVASGVGLGTTLNCLIKQEATELDNLRDAYRSIGSSFAHLCLYIGFKENSATLGLDKFNTWIYPSADHDGNIERFYQDPSAELPMLFVSFPSAKDPTWPDRYPGRSTATVMTFAPYSWFEKWQDTKWQKRGDSYQEFKDYFAARLLAELYKLKPQLEGKIDYCELSTPLSTKHFVNHQRGEIYGLAHTAERFQNYWLRPTTAIKNLFLTGQDISTNGVGGALYGAMLCASSILGRNCVAEILSNQAP